MFDTASYLPHVFACFRASMDDGTLAVASRDKSLSLWRSGRLVRVLKGHEHCVTALVSLPNGTLASGDFKGTIKFWRQGFLLLSMFWFGFLSLFAISRFLFYHVCVLVICERRTLRWYD